MIQADAADEGHRGLLLIHFLTKSQWGVTLDARGKTVHADLEITKDSAAH